MQTNVSILDINSEESINGRASQLPPGAGPLGGGYWPLGSICKMADRTPSCLVTACSTSSAGKSRAESTGINAQMSSKPMMAKLNSAVLEMVDMTKTDKAARERKC
jgi:hypothetical protein